MKKIINPFVNNPLHQHACFGCSPSNPIGLNLQFWDAGEETICKWLPKKQFEGYHNIIHGGIQATIHDEIASWAIYTKCETMGVTSNIDVRYKNPLIIKDQEIVIRARIENPNTRLVTVITSIEDQDGVIYSTGKVTYFVFPKKVALEKYNYPGVEAFYEK